MVPYDVRPMSDPRRTSPAAERNKGPILEVLRRVLPERGRVLEVAAGTGIHTVHFAKHLPGLEWVPCDKDAEAIASIRAYRDDAALDNLREPMQFDVHSAYWPIEDADAVLCCNFLQVSPWTAAEALMRGAAYLLNPGAPLIFYGPLFIEGKAPGEGNLAFDASLRERNEEWGVRSLSDLETLAMGHGFECPEVVEMPSNNLIVIYRRCAPHPNS